MPEEGFLRRWARVKASGGDAVAEAPAAIAPAGRVPAPARVPVPASAPPLPDGAQQGGAPAPTLAEASELTPASDFSAFVGQGVDKDVRRLALKKLFSDPHFNVMDRLDMYMDDYNKPDPVSAAMLAALHHARGVLRRPEEVQAELARLAALDPPEHAAGVLKSAPGVMPAAPIEAPQHAGVALAEPGEQAGTHGHAVEGAESDTLEQASTHGHAVEGAAPDTLVQIAPVGPTSFGQTPAVPGLAVAPCTPAAGQAPVAVESGNDAVALTNVRAHNGATRP